MGQDVGGVDRCMPITNSCSCNINTAGFSRLCENTVGSWTCEGVETCKLLLKLLIQE